MTVNANVREVIAYIHGVSNDIYAEPHTDLYNNFNQSVRHHRDEWPSEFCGVEWGSKARTFKSTGHALLTEAQRELGARVFSAIDKQRDWPWHPSRLLQGSVRELIFYGFGDMFYYTSEEGKEDVRNAMANQIVAHIRELNIANDEMISLTLVGHSAGAVVAFDFLFYLFSGEKYPRKFSPKIRQLAKLAKVKKLRVRRLITMGAPIAGLPFRSNKVVAVLSEGGRLKAEHYGLTQDFSPPNELKTTSPRWLNFWDKDDPIAWPVEPLMERDSIPTIKDAYVDVSDSPVKAHGAYWTSPKVIERIANDW